MEESGSYRRLTRQETKKIKLDKMLCKQNERIQNKFKDALNGVRRSDKDKKVNQNLRKIDVGRDFDVKPVREEIVNMEDSGQGTSFPSSEVLDSGGIEGNKVVVVKEEVNIETDTDHDDTDEYPPNGVQGDNCTQQFVNNNNVALSDTASARCLPEGAIQEKERDVQIRDLKTLFEEASIRENTRVHNLERANQEQEIQIRDLKTLFEKASIRANTRVLNLERANQEQEIQIRDLKTLFEEASLSENIRTQFYEKCNQEKEIQIRDLKTQLEEASLRQDTRFKHLEHTIQDKDVKIRELVSRVKQASLVKDTRFQKFETTDKEKGVEIRHLNERITILEALLARKRQEPKKTKDACVECDLTIQKPSSMNFMDEVRQGSSKNMGLDSYSKLSGPSSFPSATSSAMHGESLGSHRHVEWQSTGIEVMIKQTHPKTRLRGQTGVLRDVYVGTCAVFLLHEERTVFVLSHQLLPTTPKNGDRVKVMGTDLDGAIGVLKTVDAGDGVVSIHGDIQFIPLSYLARVLE